MGIGFTKCSTRNWVPFLGNSGRTSRDASDSVTTSEELPRSGDSSALIQAVCLLRSLPSLCTDLYTWQNARQAFDGRCIWVLICFRTCKVSCISTRASFTELCIIWHIHLDQSHKPCCSTPLLMLVPQSLVMVGWSKASSLWNHCKSIHEDKCRNLGAASLVL